MFPFVKKLDPELDYVGQELSQKLMYIFVMTGYLVAFLTGVILRDLTYTLYLGIATVILAFIVTIPGWAYFRKNPLKFKKEPKVKKE